MKLPEVKILGQIEELLECDLLDSAEHLCSLFLADSSLVSSSSYTALAVLERKGDIAVRKQEHRRALAIYLQLESMRRAIQKDTDSVRLKVSNCYSTLKDYSSALKELRMIPANRRDAMTLIALGRLYKLSGLKDQAITCFKEALKLRPYAVELIESLVELGAPTNDVIDALDGSSLLSFGKSHGSTTNDNDDDKWISVLAKALLFRREGDFQNCADNLSALQASFPSSSYVQTQLALCLTQADRMDQAQGMFKKVRQLDPHQVNSMDVYGYLLFSSATGETELNKLAVDLMGFETTPVQRSQAWAVAALYSERKGDPEKAMLFIENAVRCNPHSAFTYRLKGLLLLNNNNLEQAVVSFRQANMVTKEIETYAGLVKAHLDLGQLKEAAQAYKEALDVCPRSSLAYVLKGKVIEKMAAPQRQAEALAAYSTALKLNPGSVTCIVSKSEMLVALLRHKEAIALLQQAARANSCPLLLLALGRVLSGTGRYMEALDQLQLCAALAEGTLEGNEASEEIDRVESQLAAMREEEEAGGFEHEEQEETNFVIGSSDIL